MDLIDSYLRKVSLWLPSRKRRRVLDDLREDLVEQLGDSPSPEHGQGVLRRFGHPPVVAARYLRMHPVIDGMLAPTYYVVLGLSLLVGLIVHASMLIRNAVLDVPLVESISAVAANAINGLFVVYGVVTILFTLFSHVLASRGHAKEDRATCGP